MHLRRKGADERLFSFFDFDFNYLNNFKGSSIISIIKINFKKVLDSLYKIDYNIHINK